MRPLVDLLRSQLTGHAVAMRATELDPAVRELLLLLPGILPPPGDLVAEPAIDPEARQRRIVAALTHYLSGLIDVQPLLLVFEDVQWSDDASLELLVYLARFCATRRICLLATYRSEDGGSRLQHWLARLDRERVVQELSLARLTADEVAAMLRAIFALDRPVRPEFVEAIYALTDGNPFFIEEAPTVLIAEGDIFYGARGWDRKPLGRLHIPRSVQDAVRQRVERLSVHARQALMLAAVIGRRFDYPLLSALTRLDDRTLISAIKEVISAHLVMEETADQFAFRHALTQQAVYADLLARERRALHRSVAELIERQDGGIGPERHAGELAYHYAEAHVRDRALAYAHRAGDQARMLYAPQAAVQQYTRALDVAQRLPQAPLAQLRLAGAASHEMLGDLAAAVADCAAALRLAQQSKDARTQWEALLALGALGREGMVSRARAVRKGPGSVRAGIQTVTRLMSLRDDGTRGLYVDPRCVHTIAEFESYAYATSDGVSQSSQSRRDGSEEPIKLNDHAMDALRYALFSELGSAGSTDAYIEEMARWLSMERRERRERDEHAGD